MNPLGVFHEPLPAARLAFLGTVLLAGLFARLQLSLRSFELTTWWASNGRDVLIVFSLGALTTALAAMGFPWAAALLWAAQLTAVEVAVEVLLLRLPRAPLPDVLAILAVVAVSLPLALAPELCFRASERAVAALVG